MAFRPLTPPGPVEAVLFDMHSTLIDPGDPAAWLERAWHHARRPGTAREGLGAPLAARLTEWLDRIWEHAHLVDPDASRDFSPARHRAVYDEVAARAPGLEADPALAAALYGVMLDTWTPYEDAPPVVRALHARGLRLALLSNIGVDVRPVLERGGMGGLFHAVVLSFEVGAVKPQPAIFQRALELLGVAPDRALMVGDSARDDGGAALLGIRTLLLPRTSGSVHGLDLVLRIVGG